jgi:inhibitor of cysteine peptidase
MDGMLVLDESRNNGTADVLVGEQFQVQLSENPTTGYRWRLRSIERAACRVVQDAFETSQSGYGGGGTRRWTFAADQAAVAALHMELTLSGQQQPAQTFDVTVNIRGR